MVLNLHLNQILYLMIEVKVAKNYGKYYAFFKDSKGFETKFEKRTSLKKLLASIKEHFEERKESYTIIYHWY